MLLQPVHRMAVESAENRSNVAANDSYEMPSTAP